MLVRQLTRQLTTPLNSALSGVAEAITRVLIDLTPTSGAFYSLDTPWAAAGNFEVELDFSTVTSVQEYILDCLDGGFIRVTSGKVTMRPEAGASFLNTSININDGLLNTLKLVANASGGAIYINGSLASSDSQDWTAFNPRYLARRAAGDFFKGITSNVKLTDVDTPSNSLEFALNQLTDNTETNNGVTLTYNNIGTANTIRDTYTLSADGTQLISDLRTIDIAAQA